MILLFFKEWKVTDRHDLIYILENHFCKGEWIEGMEIETRLEADKPVKMLLDQLKKKDYGGLVSEVVLESSRQIWELF